MLIGTFLGLSVNKALETTPGVIYVVLPGSEPCCGLLSRQLFASGDFLFLILVGMVRFARDRTAALLSRDRMLTVCARVRARVHRPIRRSMATLVPAALAVAAVAAAATDAIAAAALALAALDALAPPPTEYTPGRNV